MIGVSGSKFINVMLVFALISLVACEDLSKLRNDLNDALDAFEKEVAELADLRNKLEVLNPEQFRVKNQLSNKEEEKELVLESIDKSQSEELENSLTLSNLFKSRKAPPIGYPISFCAGSIAPVFKFKPFCKTVATKLLVDPIPEPFECQARQIRFEFYLSGKKIFKSKVLDLPNGFKSQILLNLETEVVFDQLRVNIFQNWGNMFETYLPKFHVRGPENQMSE